MSTRITVVLIGVALLAALIFTFLTSEQNQSPTADSTGLPEDSQRGSVAEPTDTLGRTSQAVVGEPVNPVIDRWGVPSGEVVQLTPEESARISSESRAGGMQNQTTGSRGGQPQPIGLEVHEAPASGSVGLAPEASDTGIMGPAPEASDPGVMGPAPEAFDPGIMGPAPEAGVSTIPGLAPEAGVPNIPGPAPEASDPGTFGPAPEAGDIGPGGQQPGTDGPPPEGY